MKASGRVKLIMSVAVVCLVTVAYEVSQSENENNITQMIQKQLLRRDTKTSPDKLNLRIDTQGTAAEVAKSASVADAFFPWEPSALTTGGTAETPDNSSAAEQGDVRDDREKVFAARRDLARQGCQRHGTQTSFSNNMKLMPFDQLRWLKKRDMVVCFSAKVGTSTWLNYLLQDKFSPSEFQKLTNGKTPLHTIAQLQLKPEFPGKRELVVAQLLNSTKVANVRHPFARLVSAYRDKFEPCLTQSTCYAKIYVKEWESLLTFEAFVEYLVRRVPASFAANRENFLLFDRHWRPYYLNCAMCDIDYDYIVKMETWDDDIRYILNKFGFDQAPNSHGNRKDSDAVALEYFKVLPQSLIYEVYERYAIDFEMFGYTLDRYLK